MNWKSSKRIPHLHADKSSSSSLSLSLSHTQKRDITFSSQGTGICSKVKTLGLSQEKCGARQSIKRSFAEKMGGTLIFAAGRSHYLAKRPRSLAVFLSLSAQLCGHNFVVVRGQLWISSICALSAAARGAGLHFLINWKRNLAKNFFGFKLGGRAKREGALAVIDPASVAITRWSLPSGRRINYHTKDLLPLFQPRCTSFC